MKTLYSTLLAFGFLFHASAQDRCTTHSITERWLQAHGRSTDLLHAVKAVPSGAYRGGVLTIPVAVHVVWNSAAENVSDATVQAMIATMNTDYAALNSDYNSVRSAFLNARGVADIQFCLASVDPNGNSTSGVTHTQTTDNWFDPDTETDDMKSAPKGIAPWDPLSYLNIWICDISSGLGGGLITTGYAYLPFGGMVGSDVDGIVLDCVYGVGSGDRTATHEAGHYLGLLHPWADGGCGSDDGMADVPETDSPTFSCSVTNLMKCGFLTQYENFMDYSNCSCMFSAEQCAQMNAVLNTDRVALLTSAGCGNAPSGPCVPTSLNGTNDGDFLDGVMLNTINNTGSGSVSGPTYHDYTALSTVLTRGTAYSLVITSGAYDQDLLGAWIDLNANDTYEEAEFVGGFVSSVPYETASFDFTVPNDATLGQTTMRVRCIYPDINNGEPNTIDPCFSFSWGETEDYGIVIETSTGIMNPSANTYVPFVDADAITVRSNGTERPRSFTLLDASGRVVRAGAGSANDDLRIGISGLTPGLYLLSLEGASGRWTGRVVVTGH